MKRSRGSDAHLLIPFIEKLAELKPNARPLHVNCGDYVFFQQKFRRLSSLRSQIRGLTAGVARVQLQVRKQTVGCATCCTRWMAPRGQNGMCPPYVLIIGRL